MSTSRRQAREYALQVLYQVDLSGVTPRQALALFWQNFEPKVDSQEFTNELVEGTWRERERIDKMIANVAENWRLGRLPRVDLNLLRLGVHEILSYPQISPGVTINEAIELAKKFGTENSGSFVNGILDQIHPASRG